MIEVELHINIKFNNRLLLTPERINLLRKVKQTGSLNAASKEMSMSYQNAWTTIDEMNKIAPSPLVLKQRGGTGGGGAVISGYGDLILKEYAAIEQQVEKFGKKLNTEINL